MRQTHKICGHVFLLPVVRDCFESLSEVSLWVSPVLSVSFKIVLGGVVQCLGDDVIREVFRNGRTVATALHDVIFVLLLF